MKITSITDEYIKFNNAKKIKFFHKRDCCECNYADFNYLNDEPEIYNYEFDEDLCFEECGACGFRFGNKDGKMFFVPCYSKQNGYYSRDVDIMYNGKMVLNDVEGKWVQ